MAIERARVRALPRPWGVVDLTPWSNAGHEGHPIGEIWYERPNKGTQDPSLLLKLLFTSQPLSIQVHPNDAFAQSIGLPNGKTEAWYVLSAATGAKVGLGLKRRLTQQQLRAAVNDGSILDLVVWRTALPDDVISVPAGTIHAIGAGLVVAEIQQRSDATFRLFDFGRQRELRVEEAIAVADAGPARFRVRPNRFTEERTLLVSGTHFELATSDAVFAQLDRVDIHVGAAGMKGLVAYTGIGPVTQLLRRLAKPGSLDETRRPMVQVSTPATRTTATSTNSRPETTK